MIYSVDRTEWEYAVLIDENGDKTDVLLSELPQVREGDVLERTESGFRVREDLTESKRERIAKRTRSMFE